MNRKKNICIDFDGVLNTYTGWQGEDELFEPREGCHLFLQKLSKSYDISVFTIRDAKSVQIWLQKYDLDKFILNVTNTKIPAEIFIDDRAINFDGNYESLLLKIKDFIPHWKK